MASKCASASRPLLRQSCPRVALRKLNLPVTHRKLSHLRVTCLRRIRRFFFAAASVACPLRKIRRLSPRIRRLSASPKNRDCPTRSHRRIRCYHPFPVAAASVAKPRHPIRPNPPPAPSAACPRSRVRCSRIAAVSCSRNAVTRRNIMQPYHAAATRRRIEPPYRCCRSLL